MFKEILEAYQKSGKNFFVYKIYGCLLDNYIIIGEGLKTCIIKEVYLNEWSSDQKIRLYKKTPAKYATVIDLLEEGKEEEAEKLFWK